MIPKTMANTGHNSFYPTPPPNTPTTPNSPFTPSSPSYPFVPQFSPQHNQQLRFMFERANEKFRTDLFQNSSKPILPISGKN